MTAARKGTLIVRETRTWRLTPPDAALQTFLAHLPVVKPKLQTVFINAAYDRILAEDVISDRSIPPLPRVATLAATALRKSLRLFLDPIRPSVSAVVTPSLTG